MAISDARLKRLIKKTDTYLEFAKRVGAVAVPAVEVCQIVKQIYQAILNDGPTYVYFCEGCKLIHAGVVCPCCQGAMVANEEEAEVIINSVAKGGC